MPGGVSFRDRAEAAPPRAPVAQNHERGGAAMEALVDVGATRRLTHRVQVQLPQSAFEPVEGFEMGTALARPFGEPRPRRRADLHQVMAHTNAEPDGAQRPPVRSWLTQRLGVVVRTNQYTRKVVGARTERCREAFVLQRPDHVLGRIPVGRGEHLPVRSGGRFGGRRTGRRCCGCGMRSLTHWRCNLVRGRWNVAFGRRNVASGMCARLRSGVRGR